MQTSWGGKSSLTASPRSTSSFFWAGVPMTRLVISLAMRGSSSTATSLLAFSRMRTLMLPVPGPISSTVSVGLRLAFSTMASAIPGFLRMCWPTLVLNLKTLFFAAADDCFLEGRS